MYRVVWSRGHCCYPLVQGHTQGQDRFNYSLISKIRWELLLTQHPAAGYAASAPGDN